MSTVREITNEQVKQEISKIVNDTTCYPEKYGSCEEAIEAIAKTACVDINEFAVLDQETIDQQEENYSGYLSGAQVGDIVWGDNEMWVSLLVFDGWMQQVNERVTGEYDEINDIAELVKHEFIHQLLIENNEESAKKYRIF
ncbi:hypothetical protein [Vibrio alginolyticus]|uniref:hypothetical protein n=1 Tax=Vibrio alginolyticus TaxID=663 RepID=UPI00124D7CCE|nr:hypothetical protein [Vibrio alginolyticus]KAB2112179.1 hypothetical protein F6475_19165 [Vibrio alginolyticus]